MPSDLHRRTRPAVAIENAPPAETDRAEAKTRERKRTVTDGGRVRVPIDDWTAIADHLRRFATGGQAEVTYERIGIQVGSARFAVTQAGGVDTGMPLHELSVDGVEALTFDHDAGVIRVEGENVQYEFRRP